MRPKIECPTCGRMVTTMYSKPGVLYPHKCVVKLVPERADVRAERVLLDRRAERMGADAWTVVEPLRRQLKARCPHPEHCCTDCGATLECSDAAVAAAAATANVRTVEPAD